MATLTWMKTNAGHTATGGDGRTYTLLKTPGRRFILRINDAEHGKQDSLARKQAEAQQAEDEIEDLVAEETLPDPTIRQESSLRSSTTAGTQATEPEPIVHSSPAIVMGGGTTEGDEFANTLPREVNAAKETPEQEFARMFPNQQMRLDAEEAAAELEANPEPERDYPCCTDPDCGICYGSGIPVNPEEQPKPELPPLPPPAGSEEPPAEDLPPLPPPAGTEDVPPADDTMLDGLDRSDPFDGLYSRPARLTQLPLAPTGRPVLSWLG